MDFLTRKEELVLLSVYRLKERAYLIPIREQIKQFTGKYYSVGTIFAPLNRLDRKGYLAHFFKKADEAAGGKPIKYYKITPKGYEVLAEIKKLTEETWAGFEFPGLEKSVS